MADSELREEWKDIKISPAWKYIVKKIEEKKAAWKDLAFETNPKSENGVNNILHYQAMYECIDAVLEEIDDIIND